MTALIIDDDLKSHKVLKNLLAYEHQNLEVLGSAFSVQEGFDLSVALKPDLLFLDIELPDGLGFDLLSRLQNVDIGSHVIFITAYNKYAITAIRFGALDFLVKPIDEEELAFALNKAQQMHKQKISNEQIQILLESFQKAQRQELPTRIAITSKSEIAYILVEDIIRLEANSTYTYFYIHQQRNPIVASLNLGKYIDQFKLYKTFIQVHRSHMINLKYVKKYRRGDQTILLRDGTEIPISKSFLDDFKGAMDNL